MQNNHIAVAMSGGVDSSVVAALLQKQGYEVSGITMVIAGSMTEGKTAKMLSDARLVAEFLNIEHVTVDLREEFKEVVLRNFLAEYNAGRTPNPCIVCNKHIKFGSLIKSVESHGWSKMATGHYVSNVYDEDAGIYRIYRGKDLIKDQSYMMYTFDQEQLSSIVFPLAQYNKAEVRQMAIDWKLPIAYNAESQDICFIEDDNYQSYIDTIGNIKKIKGKILDYEGNLVGEHEGIQNYTIGQRKGLGVALGYPAYVIGIDAEKHIVTLGPNELLMTTVLHVKNVNWLTGGMPQDKDILVKIRYRSKPQAATIVGVEGDCLTIRFKEVVRAVTPGQSAVFYKGEEMLGGGIIQN